MKTIRHFLISLLLKIPSLRKKEKGVFENHKWVNGGLDGAALPTYDVKFKSY